MAVLQKGAGVTEAQTDFRWSNAQQLAWRNGYVGNKLELVAPVAQEGKYRLVIQTTRANDYGVFQFSLDGKKLGEPVDFYSAESVLKTLTLATRRLRVGPHILGVEIVGANPAAQPHPQPRHMFGLDYLRLQPTD